MMRRITSPSVHTQPHLFLSARNGKALTVFMPHGGQRRPLQLLSSSRGSCYKINVSSASKRQRQQQQQLHCRKHGKSSLAPSTAAGTPTKPTELSWPQIRSVLISASVPMIGFGFMDNFIMIQAGSMIDNTIGVKLGLATMTAAALGQVVSDTCGVLFGSTLERVLAIRPAQLTAAQQVLPVVPRLRLAGAVIGVIVGCSLGAVAGLSLGIGAVDDDAEEHRRRRIIHRLQHVLQDVMTNPDDKWAKHGASCTLFMANPASGGNVVYPEVSSPTATVCDLSSCDDTNASQCATDGLVFSFEHCTYLPIMKFNTILGVLKISMSDGRRVDLEDAEQVARNLSYIMIHMTS